MNVVYSANHTFFTDEQFKKLKKLESIKSVNIFIHVGDGGPPPLEIKTVDYLINTAVFKDHDLDEFENLKQIQLFSAGTDALDMDLMNKKGIIVKNAKNVYSIPIAEFTVMRVMEIFKSAKYFEKVQKEKSFEKKRDLVEVCNKTAAIYGYGDIGSYIAKMLKGFNVTTIGVSRSRKTDVYLDEAMTMQEASARINEFDIVISCLPLNEQTNAYFDADYFDKMKDKSVFINISRGGVVDEKALIEFIKKDKFLGVALDVFSKEPLSEDSELWDLPNVYYSPHNSFASTNMYKRLFDRIYDNLVDFIKENK